MVESLAPKSRSLSHQTNTPSLSTEIKFADHMSKAIDSHAQTEIPNSEPTIFSAPLGNPSTIRAETIPTIIPETANQSLAELKNIRKSAQETLAKLETVNNKRFFGQKLDRSIQNKFQLLDENLGLLERAPGNNGYLNTCLTQLTEIYHQLNTENPHKEPILAEAKKEIREIFNQLCKNYNLEPDQTFWQLSEQTMSSAQKQLLQGKDLAEYVSRQLQNDHFSNQVR